MSQKAPRANSDKNYKSPKLTSAEGVVSIGQAAKILGVSIDTVRRWDKNGTLSSTRPDGKNRYFDVTQLESLKFAKTLSISEAAEQLDLSPSTLRRLEKKGLITPQRNTAGERVYDLEALQSFLHSDYFVRQREVEQEILEPLTRNPGDAESEKKEAGREKGGAKHDPAIHALLGEHHLSLESLNRFKRIFLTSLAVVAGAFASIIVVLTIMFMLFPEGSAKTFGYVRANPASKKFIYQPRDSLLARQMRPFSQTSLRVVEAINAPLREKIDPTNPIKDVNDVFAPDAEGNVESKFTFSFPDTSYLKIPDTGLIVNLNSEFLQGKKPGCEKGDLAIVGACKGETTTTKLVGGGGGGTTFVNNPGSNSQKGGGSGDITAVTAGDGLSGGGTTGSVTLDIGVGDGLSSSSDEVNLELQTGSGLQTSSSGLSLIRTCASNEILKWNGTTWICAADDSGGAGGFTLAGDSGTSQSIASGDTLSVLGGAGLASVAGATDSVTLSIGAGSGITANANDIAVNLTTSGTTGASSSNSGLEVSSSGLTLLKGCSDNEILKYTDAGGWACAADGGSGASTLIVQESDGSPSVNPTSTLQFATSGFTVTDQGGGTALVTLGSNVSLLGQTISNAELENSTVSYGGVTLSLGGTDATPAFNLVDATGLQINNGTTGTLDVNRGGTGATSLTSNGVLYGNGTSAVQSTAAGTSGQLLVANASGVPTFVSLSGDGSLSSSGALTIGPNSVALGTDTTGDYVSTLTGGAGLTGSGSGEGSTPTLAVGAGNGITVNADDIAVNLTTSGTTGATASNSGLEVSSSGLTLLKGCADNQVLKYTDAGGWACAADNSGGGGSFSAIRETDGSPSVASPTELEFGPTTSSSDEFIVTDQGSGVARVRLGNNVLQTTNYSTTLDAVYVNVGESPAAGDITGSFSGGLNVGANAVALGTDTTGDYLATLATGNGLSGSGSGEGSTPTINLVLQANKGLEVDGNGLSFIDCALNEILKYNASNQWACATDGGGSGSFTNFTVAGDGGVSQTIDDGNTLSILGGNGLSSTGSATDTITFDIGAGNGITVGANDVGISLLGVSDSTGSTSSFSGLEFGGGSSNQLTLLQGCSDGQALLWNDSSEVWQCGAVGGGGGSSLTVSETDGTPAVINTSSLQFGPVANSSDEFIITDETGGVARIRIGNQVALLNQNETVTGNWTFSGALDCTDCIALGSETSGDYVSSLTSGNGLAVTGGTGEGSTPSLAVALLSASDGTGSMSSNSGLEFGGTSSDRLTLLQGCGNGQVLKWDEGSEVWFCDNDAGSSTIVRESDGSPALTTTTLEFGPASSSSDEFILSDQGSNVTRVRAGTQVGLLNEAETVTQSWTFSSGLSCSDCITLGSETAGNYVAEITAGNGLTGSVASEGATPTLDIGAGNGISVAADAVSVALNTIADTATTNSSKSGLEFGDTGGLSLLQGCASGEILKYNGTNWACGGDAGSGSFPFTSSGGIIDKATPSDRLRLAYGDAGDIALEITNTNAGVAPTADSLVLDLTGGTSGTTTDGVDGIFVQMEVGNGTNNTNSGVHIDIDPVAASGDETFYGLQIDGIVGTAATEHAIKVGSGWDFVLESGSVDISGTGNVTGVNNLSTSGSLTFGAFNCTTFLNGGVLTTDSSGNVTCADDDGGSGTSWSSLSAPSTNLNLLHAENTTAFNWNTAPTTTANTDYFTLRATNDSVSDAFTQRLMVLENVANASTNVIERLLVLNNADAQAVPVGLEFDSSGAGGITTAIDASDALIGTAISIGANDIQGTNFSVNGGTGAVTSGTINGQTLSSAASFTGTVAVNTSVSSPLYTGSGSVTYTAANGAGVSIGGASITSLTVVTNGTGDAEVVLPDQSIGSLELVDGSITQADIQDDSLDFVDFQDTLNIDAATTIELDNFNFTINNDGASSNFAVNLSSTGDFLVQDNGTAFVTFADDGTTTINSGGLAIASGALALNSGSLTSTTSLTIDPNAIINIGSNDNIQMQGTGSLLLATGRVDSSGTLNLGTATATSALLGSASLGSFTVQTNGTGDSEVVLPNQSIGSAELADGAVMAADIADDSLDFIKFDDSLDLDDPTTISWAPATDASGLDLNFTPTGAPTAVVGFEVTPAFTASVTNQTLTGLRINPASGNSASGDTLIGLSLDDIASTASTSTALYIGSGWDTSITALGLIDTQGQLQTGTSNVTLTNASGFIQAGSYEAASIDGDDIASNIAGQGLVLTAGSPDQLDIELVTAGAGSGSTFSGSGLEFIGSNPAGKLGLIQGCNNGEVLKWLDASDIWQCSADVSSGTPSLDTITAALSNTPARNSNDNTLNWNWRFTTPGSDAGMNISENVASTSGGQDEQSLVRITTLSGSTAAPLQVTSAGTDVADIYYDLTGTGDFEVRDGGVRFVYLQDDGTITLGKDAVASTVNIGVGTAADTINIGTGTSSADDINIGNLISSTDLSLAAGTGGIDLDTTGQLFMRSQQAATDAVRIIASDATGGIDVDAGTGGVAIDATGALSFDSTALASNFNLSATSSSAATLTIGASNGGAGDATLNISADNSLNLDASAGNFSIDGTTSSNASVTGSGQNLTLAVAGGGAQSLILNSAGTGSSAIDINATAGGIEMDATGVIEINSSAGVIGIGNDAVNQNINIGTAGTRFITIGSAATNTGVDIVSNSSGIELRQEGTVAGVGIDINTSNAGIDIFAGGASNGDINMTAEDVLNIASTAGATNIDSAGALSLNSSAGLINIGDDAVAQGINIGTGAAARTITIGNVTGGTALDLTSGIGGIDLLTTGSGDITLNSDDALDIDADAALQINSSGGVISIGNDADAFAINIGTGAAARTITIGNSTGATSLILDAGSAGISLGDSSADSVTSNAAAWAFPNNTTVALNNSATALSFDSGTFRIDALNNRVGINTAPTQALDVAGDIRATGVFRVGASGGITLNCSGLTPVATTNQFVGGIVSGTGSCAAASDLRLKENIQELDTADSLAKLKELRAVTFKYNDKYKDLLGVSDDFLAPIEFGFIAQEVEQLWPGQMVGTFIPGTDYMALNYERFIPILTSAVQELDEKVDANALIAGAGLQSLEEQFADRNAAVDTQLADIQSRLSNLENEPAPQSEQPSQQTISAEMGQTYYTDDSSIESGDVVMLDPAATGKVKKADQPSANTLIGVVVNGPGLLVDSEGSGASVTVATAGRISVKVSTENGAISEGDMLTSSSQPGVAMRAGGNAPVIGRAIMGYSSEGVGSIPVLVDNGVNGGDISFDLDGINQRLTDVEDRLNGIEGTQSSENPSSETGTQSSDGQDIDLSDLTVGKMTVELDLIVEGSLVVEGPATFKEMARFESDVEIEGDVAVAGQATFNNDTAGYAIIKPGDKEVEVTFTKPKSSPPVIALTLGDGKFAQYSYKDVTAEGFTIVLAEPAASELNFSWTAVNVSAANTYQSSP